MKNEFYSVKDIENNLWMTKRNILARFKILGIEPVRVDPVGGGQRFYYSKQQFQILKNWVERYGRKEPKCDPEINYDIETKTIIIESKLNYL